MSTCKREKTNSITHLVKTVAKEVYKEEFNTIEHRLCKLETKAITVDMNPRSFINAGTSWHPFEQDKLKDEVFNFIDKTAYSHKRSRRAVNLRIQDILKEMTGPKKY